MPSRFSPPSLAEHVILAVEAVVAMPGASSIQTIAEFCDLPTDQAESALLLASDIGFLTQDSQGKLISNSPLCRFVSSTEQMQKAAALRVLLEDYPPFLIFRERLRSNSIVIDAARQTKALLSLSEHHTDIGSTLLSLGTYGQAVFTEGGGRYQVKDGAAPHLLEILMRGCGDLAAAEARIRLQLGSDAVDKSSLDEVITPLADALRCAIGNDPRGAVVHAGNAVESFLMQLGVRISINLAGKPGINAKIDEIRRLSAAQMPNKLSNMGKYLGHTRNAADHGNDPEVGDSWHILSDTGMAYVFVACSFIAALTARELAQRPTI